jgi:hypothetical protein
MRTLDGYLSRLAQRASPRALVYHEDRRQYVLELPDEEPIILGQQFRDAKRAIEAFVVARNNRNS